MQLNTPSDQRQRHNYLHLFIKITSSLCLYFFSLLLVLVVVLVNVIVSFFVCFCCFFCSLVFSFHLESKKGLHVLSLFPLEQVILILDNFMMCVYFK